MFWIENMREDWTLLTTSAYLHVRKLPSQASRRVFAERGRAQWKHNVAGECFIVRKVSASDTRYRDEDEEDRAIIRTKCHVTQVFEHSKEEMEHTFTHLYVSSISQFSSSCGLVIRN